MLTLFKPKYSNRGREKNMQQAISRSNLAISINAKEIKNHHNVPTTATQSARI